MPAHVIVWDLETVPDLKGFAAANDLYGRSDDEIRETMGDKFPKHIYHSIACIGALIAHRDDDCWIVDALGAPHVGERTEKELIASFVDKIAELNPQLVTFNGNSFDLPVLRYRTLTHAIAAPGLSSRPYFNRYSDDAIDLCDVLPLLTRRQKRPYMNHNGSIMYLVATGAAREFHGNRRVWYPAHSVHQALTWRPRQDAKQTFVGGSCAAVSAFKR
jgi:predicted PolB exonuclease-like 3'-5' exonuclease